jgi:hypothetical protein
MLMQNMAVKDGDGYGDICDGAYLRLVATQGTNGVLLVAWMRETIITNWFFLYHGSGTDGGVIKITEIS